MEVALSCVACGIYMVHHVKTFLSCILVTRHGHILIFQCIYFGLSSLSACSRISLFVLWYLCCAQESIIKSLNHKLVCLVPVTSDFLCLSHWYILNKIWKAVLIKCTFCRKSVTQNDNHILFSYAKCCVQNVTVSLSKINIFGNQSPEIEGRQLSEFCVY